MEALRCDLFFLWRYKMKNVANHKDELIIDKCLIIDDEFEEVKDLIFKLNDYAISTDYRKDVLGRGVKIDPNIQLVILDLFMSEGKNSIDNALQSVAFLNEKIKGPFFLLIWTKNDGQFDKFYKELCSKYSNYNNFPLDISMFSKSKVAGEQNPDIIIEAANGIIQYIQTISEKYTNIYCYMKLTKIFQRESASSWEMFKPEKLENKESPEKFSKYYEEVLGKAFYSFDKYFNYEKSGKGFLNAHVKFLEQELTVNRIDYNNISNNELDDNFKKEINSKLVIKEFKDSKPADGLPGLIYKAEKVEDTKTKELVGNIANKDKENQILADIIDKKIEIGNLVITPYCDFAQSKKKDVLYLPILIVNDEFNMNKFYRLFKRNVKYQDLHRGKYLVYLPSMYNVCDLEKLGNQKHHFYLSKEYVNEIQINVANNISRIGTTILDYNE